MYEADIAACYSSMCAAFRRDFAETSASARGSFGAALSSCGGVPYGDAGAFDGRALE